MATSQDFVNWVCSEAIDYRFLKYVLLAEREAFLRFASGTTHQTIYFPEVKAFHVCLPPIGEQRAIADTLSTLDDRIELNRRMNQTLEEIARTIFKSWFIDFDPVRAKAEGRQPAGMNADTAALFPDSFVDSELGLIPAGWNVGRLDDLFILQRGFDLPERDRRVGSVPIVSSSGVSGFHSEAKVNAPGVVTGRYGTLGQVFYISEAFWPLNTSLYVRDFKGNGTVFVYYLLRSLDLSAFSDKSSVPGLNRNHVHSLRIVVPPKLLIEQFDQVAGSLLTAMQANVDQNQTLRGIRDLVLPKLLSGELRIPMAGKVAAIATTKMSHSEP